MILEDEVFPENEVPNGFPKKLNIFNVNYFPFEKGPYNYDCFPTAHSLGIQNDGTLAGPETRWGGIMQSFPEVNYDINYIDFWLMDPFVYDENISGELYINIGTISEDALRDNRHSDEATINLSWFDNDTTIWGLVQPEGIWVSQFSSNVQQDFGLDGFRNSYERFYFDEYLSIIQTMWSPEVYDKIFNDPSNDDYHPYLGDDYDEDPIYSSIIERYKKYNNNEGNTHHMILYPNIQWFRPSSHQPNKEDVDDNEILTTSNSYFEYRININANEMLVGLNYIENILENSMDLANGETDYIKWYHYRIPIEDYTSQFGNISLNDDFESIRIYLTNFQEPMVLRFATLELTEE